MAPKAESAAFAGGADQRPRGAGAGRGSGRPCRVVRAGEEAGSRGEKHGLAVLARVLFNCNEFLFVE